MKRPYRLRALRRYYLKSSYHVLTPEGGPIAHVSQSHRGWEGQLLGGDASTHRVGPTRDAVCRELVRLWAAAVS